MKDKKKSCCITDEHDSYAEEHSDKDEHDHLFGENRSTFQLSYLP